MAASVFDVFASEQDRSLAVLAANPSLAAFVQGLIEHMTLSTASKGIRPEDIAITAPYIENHILCAQITWATWSRGVTFEPIQPRHSFAAFTSHINSAYARFVQRNASVRQFTDRVLEMLTTYANHRGVPLTKIMVDYPYVVHDQHVRASLTIAPD